MIWAQRFKRVLTRIGALGDIDVETCRACIEDPVGLLMSMSCYLKQMVFR